MDAEARRQAEQIGRLLRTMAGLLAVIRDHQKRRITSDSIPWDKWAKDTDRVLRQVKTDIPWLLERDRRLLDLASAQRDAILLQDGM